MPEYPLYHFVPSWMEGTTLYPPAILRDLYPEIYAHHMAKYADAERLLTQRIARLDCVWADVLFLSAVHPHTITEAYEEDGLDPLMRAAYQIDAATLDPDKATVWCGLHDPADPDAHVPLNLKDLKRFSVIPTQTRLHYRDACARGERPFAFMQAPHVFYRGTIDISQCPIVQPKSAQAPA